MNSFSPNMLKTFETCPKKYYFKYIKNISVPQKSSMFEKGKKIHALANYYLRGDDISKMEKALTEEEKNIWNSLKQNEFFNKTYVNSEYNLSCKVDNYWIGGRLDALMKDSLPCKREGDRICGGGIYYILDYKTGSIPKNPEYDYQTITYLLCASKMYGDNIKFVYIDLKNNQNSIIDFNTAKAQEYEKIIINICDKITNAQFPEKIEHSTMCDFCEYNKICI